MSSGAIEVAQARQLLGVGRSKAIGAHGLWHQVSTLRHRIPHTGMTLGQRGVRIHLSHRWKVMHQMLGCHIPLGRVATQNGHLSRRVQAAGLTVSSTSMGSLLGPLVREPRSLAPGAARRPGGKPPPVAPSGSNGTLLRQVPAVHRELLTGQLMNGKQHPRRKMAMAMTGLGAGTQRHCQRQRPQVGGSPLRHHQIQAWRRRVGRSPRSHHQTQAGVGGAALARPRVEAEDRHARQKSCRRRHLGYTLPMLTFNSSSPL